MALTYREFLDLTRRLDAQAEAEPRRAAMRALLVALGGYAFVLLVMVVLAALMFVLMHLMPQPPHVPTPLAILGGVFLVAYFFPRPPAPVGLPVTHEDAPPLFAALDRIRVELGAPPFDVVLIDDAANAGVYRRGYWRIPFTSRHYLVIGLPFLLTLTSAQLLAVLAHECGHVWRDHGRFSLSIGRAHVTWLRVMAAVDARRFFPSVIFRPFFRWYRPYLEAHTHAYRRASEYEADRVSVRLQGSVTAAEALLRTQIAIRLIDDYRQALLKQSQRDREPPASIVEHMRAWLREHADPVAMRGLIEQSTRLTTRPLDTHPALPQRLAALGATAADDLDFGVTADHDLLAGGELLKKFDDRWQRDGARFWASSYTRANAMRARLETLNDRAATAALSKDEAFERSGLMYEVGDAHEAIGALGALAVQHPGDAQTRMLLGRLLLARDDADGIGHVEAAIAADHHQAAHGARAVYDFMVRTGRSDEAEVWFERSMTSEFGFR